MRNVNTDLVIVGGGAAGMVAAVTAAEAGARVIVFEKAAHTGGAANLAAGPFGVESRLQRMNHVEFTRDQAFQFFMDFTHWSVDARLVRAYINKSGSTIDWLENMGVKFRDPVNFHPDGFLVWYTIIGRAPEMIKVLTKRAKELGVEIYFKAPVKQILKKKGRTVGVIAEDKSKEAIQANAKAVIIGTGGFGDNAEWMKKYFGYEWGSDLFSHRVPGLTGDGIKMAWEAGAAETDMNMVWGLDLAHPYFGPWGGLEGQTMGFGLFFDPNLMVNILGERFLNEGIVRNWPFMANAIRRQKNHCAFMIFDENARKYFDRSPRKVNLTANIKIVQDKGYKDLFAANSLEELCVKTGIDLKGLQKTVDEYNNACKVGRDELFGKSYKHLKPVEQPKFYAARFNVSGTFGTVGGIKINYKTEVLTKEYTVIPGLYATGGDANALYAGTYPLFLAGNLLGFAINSGRIAAENAFEYIKGLKE
jgi:fumarate reductase flavoprotein subunit